MYDRDNVTSVLRVYRIPFSTNVERVALALAHKGIDIEWVDVDPRDRSQVEEVSGQPLVPVLVDNGRVVADSSVILRYLEELWPEPGLFPSEPARRAELETLLEKIPPAWRPFFELLSETGLRIGEAIALRWQDVDLNRRRVHVRRRYYRGTFAPPKSRYGRRDVPLSKRLANELGFQTLLEEDPDDRGVAQPRENRRQAMAHLSSRRGNSAQVCVLYIEVRQVTHKVD